MRRRRYAYYVGLGSIAALVTAAPAWLLGWAPPALAGGGAALALVVRLVAARVSGAARRTMQLRFAEYWRHYLPSWDLTADCEVPPTP